MDRGETLAQAVVRVREAGGAFSAAEVYAVLQGEDAWATARSPSLPQVRRAITAANALLDDAAKAERKAAKAGERKQKQNDLQQQRDRSTRKRPAEERAAEERAANKAFMEANPEPLGLLPWMTPGKVTPSAARLEKPPSADAWYCSLQGTISLCDMCQGRDPSKCTKPYYASP